MLDLSGHTRACAWSLNIDLTRHASDRQHRSSYRTLCVTTVRAAAYVPQIVISSSVTQNPLPHVFRKCRSIYPLYLGQKHRVCYDEPAAALSKANGEACMHAVRNNGQYSYPCIVRPPRVASSRRCQRRTRT